MRAAPLHIALFMPSLGGGGAERVSLTLAGAFADAGHRVTLAVASADGGLAGAVPPGVDLVDFKCMRVRSALVPLARWLRRTRPDALLSSQVHANIVAFLAHRLTGSAATLVAREDSTPTRNIGGLREPTRSVIRVLMSMAYRRADAVVAVSKEAGADLQRFLPAPLDNLTVVYNPAILTRLPELAREPIDHPWIDVAGAPLIVSVGRLSEEKDYATLIRALAAMREHSNARLVILGDGDLRPGLERLIDELGLSSRVSMPGFVQNPYAYMARADLFVLSSRFEGLPTALIEALACGCQVASSDCPSGPREILKDGALGKLVPVGDVEAMSRAIEASLSSPRSNRAGPADLEQYTERYSAHRYLELIRPHRRHSELRAAMTDSTNHARSD